MKTKFIMKGIGGNDMPFKIIRNDITKVVADIIVNTANPKPKVGSGTDFAIYEEAGKNQLLEERKKIGKINRGNIAVTDAFQLNAKYIIHTVAPIWENGKRGEFEILENCYRKSLEKAVELKCESIAFPLIATGVYGFPKDKALQIAVSVFSSFLLEHDMEIILVVYDDKSFQLSNRILAEINEYIDDHYVEKGHEKEYPFNEDRIRVLGLGEKEDGFGGKTNHIGISFQDKLFGLIVASNMKNKDIWRRANIDRRLFSKIQCNENYHPKKKTVMSLCIGLKLNLEQSRDLLMRAGFAVNPSSKFDLIVERAIENKEYNIYELNIELEYYTKNTLDNRRERKR